MRTHNRWIIATAGVFMQVALGAVYAWSVFRAPLVKQFGWSISEVTLTFTISIFVLGIAAFLGGLWLNRKGPRIVAITGSSGKTSTKDILAAVLGGQIPTVASPENLNTEIGLPLAVLAAPAGTEALVLEMAMRGPGQIAELVRIAEPDVGGIGAT